MKQPKFNLKNSDAVTRSDIHSLKVEAINVNFEDNPRVDYGDDENEGDKNNSSFHELKNSIKENGLLSPIVIYIHPKDGTFHLAHGFRRMRAIHELIKEGHPIERVKVFEVPFNEETILLQHFILNTGKSLSDLELGDTLLKLSNLMGSENLADISRRSGIKYEKVVKLMKFAKRAGAKLRNAVKKKQLSIQNAISLINATDSVLGQNKAIEDAEETVGEGKKITVKDLTILKANEAPVVSKYAKLREYISIVKSSKDEGLDQIFTNRLEVLLNDMEGGELSDKHIMGTHFAVVTDVVTV